MKVFDVPFEAKVSGNLKVLAETVQEAKDKASQKLAKIPTGCWQVMLSRVTLRFSEYPGLAKGDEVYITDNPEEHPDYEPNEG